MRKNIPNLFTLCNLLLGCIAVVFLFNGYEQWVPWLVFFALVADFADGFFPRLLNAHSPIGGQLDSLADMVTFGFLPGAILFFLLQRHFGYGTIIWVSLPGFLLTLLSAVRLANFNIDERQTMGFIGLPTPSACAFVIGLLALYNAPQKGYLAYYFLHPAAIYASTVILSILLVAELPMFSNKFTHFNWQGNELRYSFGFISLAAVIVLGFAATLAIIPIYIILSMYMHWQNTIKKT